MPALDTPPVATPTLRRFFVLAFAIAWAITVPIAVSTQGWISVNLIPRPAQWLIGVAPVIAAWIATAGTPWRRTLIERTTRFRAGWQWWAVAIGLPWVLLGAGVLVRTVAGMEPAEIAFSSSLPLFALVWLVLAFGEEIGWRGLAVPGLEQRFGFWTGAAILGVVWCVWHYPKMLANPYLRLDANGLAMVGMFSVQIVIANFLICWLVRRTGSVPIAAVFHTGWNVVSTVYGRASVDPVITVALAVAVIVAISLGLGDRRAALFPSETSPSAEA